MGKELCYWVFEWHLIIYRVGTCNGSFFITQWNVYLGFPIFGWGFFFERFGKWNICGGREVEIMGGR
jgi:hypothetical protein